MTEFQQLLHYRMCLCVCVCVRVLTRIKVILIFRDDLKKNKDVKYYV